LPILVILIITIAVVLAAIELGYRVGRWRLSASNGEVETDAQLSAVTGAHLALLAFIMAFSFSMAAGHYQDRRELILADANAISTAYERASLIAAPESQDIADTLYTYLSERVAVTSVQNADSLLSRSEELQDAMWASMRALLAREDPSVLHSLLIQSLNEVSDVHDRRVAAALKNRVPRILWGILVALLALAMLGIGYFSGARGTRNRIAGTSMAISFSLVLLMIADLDRPTGGTVRADQSPLIDLRDRLQARRAP
jgi:hypothetical protein